MTEGRFSAVEWGDYLHFQMFDNNGNELSFFVIKALKPDPEQLKPGQKIRATWQRGSVFIPEADAFVVIDQLIKLELIK